MLNIQYFVNPKTRICRTLSGRGADHDANVHTALKDGFEEVTADGLDTFRAVTKLALDAGWKPNGRLGYAKFLEKHPDLIGGQPA